MKESSLNVFTYYMSHRPSDTRYRGFIILRDLFVTAETLLGVTNGVRESEDRQFQSVSLCKGTPAELLKDHTVDECHGPLYLPTGSQSGVSHPVSASIRRPRFGGRTRECKVHHWRPNITEVYCKESLRDRTVDSEWIWYGER
uniref:Uncharacterized protein n=1 Tax=Magallana gigas TaxID=29159 RepID=A0A8W8LGC8_MAGGI